MSKDRYVYQASDSLLQIVKGELARHGVLDSNESASKRE